MYFPIRFIILLPKIFLDVLIFIHDYTDLGLSVTYCLPKKYSLVFSNKACNPNLNGTKESEIVKLAKRAANCLRCSSLHFINDVILGIHDLVYVNENFAIRFKRHLNIHKRKSIANSNWLCAICS